MTKKNWKLFTGKRYAYKFDFAGLAAATQPQATDASYKYQSDLFMSPYHGAKLSSFMSPHHSMASSSGEFFTVFPSANTLTCRQSINISLNSNFPPSAIAPESWWRFLQSLQINKNQIFKSISNCYQTFRVLVSGWRKPVRSAPDNCTSLCERFPFGAIFRRSELKGKSSRKYELPWLVSPFFPLYPLLTHHSFTEGSLQSNPEHLFYNERFHPFRYTSSHPLLFHEGFLLFFHRLGWYLCSPTRIRGWFYIYSWASTEQQEEENSSSLLLYAIFHFHFALK